MKKTMSICGFSGSGKTTLIQQLMRIWKDQWSVGYIKSDAHRIQIDTPGKDTYEVRVAGGSPVYICDAESFSLMGSGALQNDQLEAVFANVDFTIIEGYKHSDDPKIVMLDKDCSILKESLKNVTAYVGSFSEKPNELSSTVIYFQRDDLAGISDFILHTLKRECKTELYGLVLCGGQSSRMQTDKGSLQYDGEVQVKRALRVLDSVAEKSFVSLREEQSDLEIYQDFSQIYDQFFNMGPVGGILSAMKMHPNKAWLVLACDLPYVTEEVVLNLLKQRDLFKMATCYESVVHEGMPEPLCGIYEMSAYRRMFAMLGASLNCPRKMLLHSSVKMVKQGRGNLLANVNTPEEYQGHRVLIDQ
jgi:molybdopterin-guanine dinucleotide biosynthesis protein A